VSGRTGNGETLAGDATEGETQRFIAVSSPKNPWASPLFYGWQTCDGGGGEGETRDKKQQNHIRDPLDAKDHSATLTSTQGTRPLLAPTFSDDGRTYRRPRRSRGLAVRHGATGKATVELRCRDVQRAPRAGFVRRRTLAAGMGNRSAVTAG